MYNLLIYNLFYSFDSSAEDSLMIKYIAETYDQMSSFQVPREIRGIRSISFTCSIFYMHMPFIPWNSTGTGILFSLLRKSIISGLI